MSFLKNIYKFLDKSYFSLALFITLYLIYSFFSYKSFPITTDEQFRYQRGAELLSHYLHSGYLQTSIFPDKEPDTYYFYVMLLNIFNPKFYYEWFHLQNMLFGLIAFVSSYFLVLNFTKNKVYSLVGPIFLFLIPGFSGLIAADPIDMPFACLMILNVFLIYKYRNVGFSFKKILILGFSFWLILGLRPVGYEMFFNYLIFTLFFTDSQESIKNRLLTEFKNLILIFFVSSFLSVISWPYLGINYFKNLPGILFVNAKYDKWDNLILFNGEYLYKDQRPWYYLFTYLGLTIPSGILFLALFSLINLKNKLKQFLIYFVLFNFFIYLLIQPVIYNGIRHFMYLLPIIGTLAAMGLWDLIQAKVFDRYKNIVYFAVASSLIWTIYQIILLFPNQYAYFNDLSGGFSQNYMNYETEYWGGTYREGSMYIRENLAKDKPQDLKVYSCNIGFSVDYYSEKKFITVIKRQEADIVICDFSEDRRLNLQGKLLKTINLGNVPYLYIRENEFKK